MKNVHEWLVSPQISGGRLTNPVSRQKVQSMTQVIIEHQTRRCFLYTQRNWKRSSRPSLTRIRQHDPKTLPPFSHSCIVKPTLCVGCLKCPFSILLSGKSMMTMAQRSLILHRDAQPIGTCFLSGTTCTQVTHGHTLLGVGWKL